MTPEIQWDNDYGYMSSPSGCDCASAANLFQQQQKLRSKITRQWWQTVIDMMLHGY